MNNIPKAWRIVYRQDGSVEIEVKQVRNKHSLINVLVLTCVLVLTFLWLVTWPQEANITHELMNGNLVLLFGVGCLVALPFAISYIFYSEVWIVARDSLTIQRSLFGIQRVRHYRSGYFEFVASEHESGHSWSLKVCSPTGNRVLFSPHSIAELDDVAQFLSKQTGWQLQEYQGP